MYKQNNPNKQTAPTPIIIGMRSDGGDNGGRYVVGAAFDNGDRGRSEFCVAHLVILTYCTPEVFTGTLSLPT